MEKKLKVYTNKTARPPDKSVYWNIIFFISHPKHSVGTQKNRLNETVPLSTQNTGSNKWVRKQLKVYENKISLSGSMNSNTKRMVWVLKRTVSMRRSP